MLFKIGALLESGSVSLKDKHLLLKDLLSIDDKRLAPVRWS